MTALPGPSRRPIVRLAPLLACAGLVALVVGAQVTGLAAGLAGGGSLQEPLVAAPPAEDAAGNATDVATSEGFDAVAELARVRADVDFWAAKLTADRADIVAAVKLAESDVALARMTGDVANYTRGLSAAEAALAAQPGYVPAAGMRAAILVSLHRFVDARDAAMAVLAAAPDDPTALGALGDARLELGDLDGARTAYAKLSATADGSASRVRTARLAFVSGDPARAVAAARGAVDDATDEALQGDGLAFYDATLGDLLLATGDADGARSAYEAALAVRPDHPASLVGLARLDAFAGDLDGAIAKLDTAIDAIPQPDWLARRQDLLVRRAGPGDAAGAAADGATIDAIARLAGSAGSVYDRVRALYLADHGLQPDLAVRLAGDELAVRKDVYGEDALAWALFNAGRPADAAAPMRAALAVGTRDAKLWYHAGLIEAADGDAATAREHLAQALALGPALDPMARDRAAAVLATLP